MLLFGSIVIRYCIFNNVFVILRFVGYSRIENCKFSIEEIFVVIIEGLLLILRFRSIFRFVDDWMVFNGIDFFGFEDLYDLLVVDGEVGVRSGLKVIFDKGL